MTNVSLLWNRMAFVGIILSGIHKLTTRSASFQAGSCSDRIRLFPARIYCSTTLRTTLYPYLPRLGGYNWKNRTGGFLSMQRLEFGTLVAMLRIELGWTQAQLAEHAEIESATLSNIERGAKKYFEPDLLFRLANALQLTSIERREFFLASCGLDHSQLLRQPSITNPTNAFETEKIIENLINLMSQMYAPAHLGDVFGDVIAVNNLLLETMQVNVTALGTFSQNKKSRINNLTIAFNPEITSVFHESSNESLIAILRAFRESSIRYRAKRRYAELMDELHNMKKYPLFARYWRRVSTFEDDREFMFDPFEITHTVHGTLRFTLTSSVIITSHGELYLSHFTPLDINTTNAIIKIAETAGRNTIQLSQYPWGD